MKLKQQHF